MTPAIHLGPAENNQSYSALTFECSTAEKLYKRIKTIKIRTPPKIPTHIHQADQLFSFLQLLQVFVTSKVEVPHTWTHLVLLLPSHLSPNWETNWVSRPPGNSELRLNVRQGNQGHSQRMCSENHLAQPHGVQASLQGTWQLLNYNFS